MLGAIVLFVLACISGLAGGGILVGAFARGQFSGLPDQILMMSFLIMSAIFLVGALVLSYLRLLLIQLRRSSELTAQALGYSPSIAKAITR